MESAVIFYEEFSLDYELTLDMTINGDKSLL